MLIFSFAILVIGISMYLHYKEQANNVNLLYEHVNNKDNLYVMIDLELMDAYNVPVKDCYIKNDVAFIKYSVFKEYEGVKQLKYEEAGFQF